MADVLGRPLTTVESPEASALGAAQLALLGAGLVGRFEDLAPMAETGEVVRPDGPRRARYARLFEAYQRLYQRVAPEFDAIARLQAELRDEDPLAALSQGRAICRAATMALVAGERLRV